MAMTQISNLQLKISEFARKREWEVFHTPKNLVMALCGEAGELSAEFQWLTPNEAQELSGRELENVRMEIADIAIYLLRLCDVLKVDLEESILRKIEINEKRFPRLNS